MTSTKQLFHKLQVAAWAIALSIGASGTSLAATWDISEEPLLSTTSGAVVLPNVMFMLDDSGSMDWDYMPDDSRNFAGRYGFNSSHCNGVYYNPAVTYAPPVDSTGASYANSSFAAAWKDGYNTGAGTVNLNTSFRGGSGTGSSGYTSYGPGPAFFFTYSGTQTTSAQMDIHNTASVYYKECNSSIGSTTAIDGTHPVNTVFTKTTLSSSVPTSILTVASSGGGATGATITVSGSKTTKVSGITVNGDQILSGLTGSSSSSKTIAYKIVGGINACTAAIGGTNCTATGYSATCPGYAAGSCTSSVVTVTGPGAASGFSPVVTNGACTSPCMSYTYTAFPVVTSTAVSHIMVGGTDLLGNVATAAATSTTTLAANIAAGISAAGYAASVSGNLVTITGPASASDILPVITTSPASGAGVMTVSAPNFSHQSTSAELQNFANWYSYYSTRMQMMKTGVGRAFKDINSQYRVGFMTMNNNVPPDIVDIAPFDAAQKALWYAKLYVSIPSNSTPLREALSHVGQLYAHKFGNITTYKATITVSAPAGSGPTAATSVTVGGTETLDCAAANSCVQGNTTSAVATNIANQINAMINTSYGATVSGSVVTITGIATSLGVMPVVTDDGGGMIFSATPFAATTTTAQLNGITPADPMQYSCQQNFVILSTDGYWNGATTYNLSNGTVGNQDGTEARPKLDGNNTSDTLSDVAEYYYGGVNGTIDLRDNSLGNCSGALGTDVCKDNVPTSTLDPNQKQHLTTFTLGLGARGRMAYLPTYQNLTTACDPATDGDFCAILKGATANGSTICPWQASGTTCNWPIPSSGAIENIDDLWHAAVNGRGMYFSATDPATLDTGLASALTGIKTRLAAASASATSSPNITPTDRSIFSSTYLTGKWTGEVTAQLIDPITGIVQAAISWTAQGQLDALAQTDCASKAATPTCLTPDISTSRHIYTFDSANASGNNLKSFIYTNLTAAEKAYFDNKCSTTYLSQCGGGMSATDLANGNLGTNLINYLRGNQSMEISGVTGSFRTRDHLLGDTVNAKPAYVRLPQYNFADNVVPSYSAFQSAEASRQGVLYMGSNDGMLHAFNSDTGAEMWAYVPKIVMPNMYKLADQTYGTVVATPHQYFVDGSPETMDIFVATATNNLTVGWHTILVGGLGHGGRGFYALDVTNPLLPKALWEICDSALCSVTDADMGFSYGNPVITKRSTDNKWVVLVASGYNNGGTGQGTLYELDAVTGAVLHKTTTGAATNPPSGLAKLSPWVDSLSTNNTSRFVYGGDLNGDVWRFDLGVAGPDVAPTVTRVASLKDASGAAQSVTTRIELGDPMNNTTNSLGATGTPALFVATGRYLGLTDLSNVQVQSVYGIKDDLSKTTLTTPSGYIGNPRAPNAGFGSFVQQYIYNVGTGATQRTTSTNAVNWSTNQGWYADFVVSDPATNLPISPAVSPGERVNIDPQLLNGSLIVVTNVPDTSACSIGGTSWLYSFNYMTGQYVTTPDNSLHIVGTKLGNALTAGIVVVRLPSGQIKALVTDAGGGKQTVTPSIQGAGSTKRTSWRELTQ